MSILKSGTSGGGGGPGGDTTAIHDNESGEISAVAEKVSPLNTDLILIEDSAAGNVKKKVQIGNLPSASGGTDHGGFSGLADDDHPQYLLADGSRPLSGTWTVGSHNIQFTGSASIKGGSGEAIQLGSGNITLKDILAADVLKWDGTAQQLQFSKPTTGIDHGDLSGLADDDHTQYLTEARHDALAADNPHSVTLTQAVTADAGTDVLASELETLTNGSDADALHTHPSVSSDAAAIHDNVANEISLITEKVTPANADLIIIEDSAASGVKRKVQIGNLPTGSGSVPSSTAKGHLLVGNGSGGWASRPFWHPEMHLIAGSSYGGLTKAGGATGHPGYPYSDPVEAYGDLQARSTANYTHRWGVLAFMPGTYDLSWTSGISDANAIIPVGANIDIVAYHTTGGYGQDDSTQPKVHVRRADISANDGLPLFGYPVGFDVDNEWHAWMRFQGINFVGRNGRANPQFSSLGTAATYTTTRAPLFRWWNCGANQIYRDCSFNDNYGPWVTVDTSIENLWFDNCFSNVVSTAIEINGWSTGGVLLLDKIQIDNFERFVDINNLNTATNLRGLVITNSTFEGHTGGAQGDYTHIVKRTTNGTGVTENVGRGIGITLRDNRLFQQDAGNLRWEAIYEELDTGDGSSQPAVVTIDNTPWRDEVYSGVAYTSDLTGLTSVGRGDKLFFDGTALFETHNGTMYRNGSALTWN